jgi:hypothetical protein
MAYIGNNPAHVGNYQKIDPLATFDGALKTFALKVGGSAVSPAKSGLLLVSIGGVMQEPDDSGTKGFKVSSSNIIFKTAPATGAASWIMYQGQNVDIGTPSDATVGVTQLSATGTASSSTFLRGDNKWESVPAGLPSQTGHSGKFLTTDAANASWGTISTIFPFFKSNGASDTIAITSGTFPFFKSNGTEDKIPVT